MGIRKVGNRWKLEYRPKSAQPIYESFATKIEATNRLKELKAQRKRTLTPASCCMTLADAIDRFIVEICPYRKNGKKEVYRLERLKTQLDANAPIVKIDFLDIEQFIRRRQRDGVKNNTIRREIALLGAVFREAIVWRWIESSPIHNVRRPKPEDGRERRINSQEIAAVCTQLGYQEDQPVTTRKQATAVAFLLALETAMRQSEIFRLQWADVHCEERYLQLHTTKNGSSRQVPLTPRAIALLDKLRHLHKTRVIPFLQGSCQNYFYLAVRAVGLYNLQFRDSRHEACYRMAKKVTILQLAKIMGHKNVNQLLTYYNPTVQELAEKISDNTPPQGNAISATHLIELANNLGLQITT